MPDETEVCLAGLLSVGIKGKREEEAIMKNCRPGILFRDGCVLQRGKPIVIWGEGENGKEVTVTLAGRMARCVVTNGRWECTLPPMDAARRMELVISCGKEMEVLRNVSIGEVWIAGGQSNMEFFLRYDAQWEDVLALPHNPDIHMFNVARLAYPEQAKDVSDSGYWFEEGDAAWPFFSAPGYSFARNIQPHLGVPVGIIGCNWGGTSASTWMDESYMEPEPLNAYLKEYEAAIEGKSEEELIRQEIFAYEAEDSERRRNEWAEVMYGMSLKEQEEYMRRGKEHPEPENPMGPYNVGRPGRLYHQMLEKIIPFSARGVLWYQGETDESHPAIYDQLFTAMIRCFRDSFRQELPFLFVQLAPYGRWLESSGLAYPELRRRQEMVSRTVPDVHMVSIMDLGMYEDIHPKRKMEVGERLALMARGKVYGEPILCESPSLAGARREEGGILLSFSETGDGLWEAEAEPEEEEEASRPSELTGPAEQKDGFVVSQNGQACRIEAVAIAGKDRIFLRVPGLTEEPCRVSFAEVPYVRVRFYNSADLPLRPFACTVE